MAPDRIDLTAWLQIFSDRDYQACSPAHRAAGYFRENGVFGTVNVENVGGHLLVHHYLADEFEPHRVVLRSRDTRVYVMHLLPAKIEVIWIMEVEPRESRSAAFRCTVVVRAPPLLNLVAKLGLLPVFLRWHVRRETPLFAADVVRKIGEGRL
ncbi:hypothetical protein [Hyphomicrobium sp.]|uniref:hypothetical protein n=1 Tax=Hyphomicrobium sp. TaxID=82 RepID=UPI001DA2DF09|nr:hypothetical protein [Hyphomicrobium sp.]MBY0561015.1 hypothetical protein [Hyphomicrobium sp.]